MTATVWAWKLGAAALAGIALCASTVSGQGTGTVQLSAVGAVQPANVAYPPVAKQVILWPLSDRPASMGGKIYTMTFTLDSAGQVSDLDISPKIEDRKYAKRVDQAMLGYRFKPARDSLGKPVAGIYKATMTISH